MGLVKANEYKDANGTGNAAFHGTPVTPGGLTFRNKIINGNFDIWQRGTNTGTWAAPILNYYWADRWVANSNGTGGTGSMSRQAFTPGQTDVPGEPTYFLRWQITSAPSGQSVGSCWIEQRVEDVRTLAGKTATLSFYAKGTGTLPNIYATQVFGSGGSTLVALTLASNVVLNSTWTKYTYTFTYPSISGKSIGPNSYVGITINVPVNSTYTLDLAQVQFEEGSVATPFEQRPLGTELSLCQRYYQRIGDSSAIIFGGYNSTGNDFYQSYTLQNEMRAAPTSARVGTWTVANGSQPVFTATSKMFRVTVTVSSTGAATAQSNANAYATFDAEL